MKKEEEQKLMRDRVNSMLAKTLLDVAVTSEYDEDDDEVKEEDQKSLSVGIIGAPNAGKSALTNFMVIHFSSSLVAYGIFGACREF